VIAPDLIDVLGAGGLLSQHLDGYTPRPGQIEMARAVELALDDSAHLIVEAPTGTGKSLAYLAPAVLEATRSNRRVLVVTGNIALQEQLITKDLPLLSAVLPVPVTFALMKGRRNFLCLDKMRREAAAGTLKWADRRQDQQAHDAVLAWSERTEAGDVSELPFEPPWSVWRRRSIGSEDCLGGDCPKAAACFSRKAKERAHQVTVVVTNYHMLFAHIAVHQATGDDLVLPPFDIVILDEAHAAAQIAREFFGYRLSMAGLQRVAAPLKEMGRTEEAAELRAAGQSFCADLARVFRSDEYSVRLRRPRAVDSADLHAALQTGMAIFTKAGLRAQLKEERKRFKRLMERCTRLSNHLSSALDLTNLNAVSFIELDRNGRGVLCSRHIDVSQHIRAGLFERARSVIATSATLSTGGSFELVRGELGVPNAGELIVESPFDHAEQCLLVIPEGLPDPTEPTWRARVARLGRRVAVDAGGRTLGLFTSYRCLESAHHALMGTELRVLRQGQMPRMALTEAFRQDVGSVLLGTDSFWTGIDVPGEALSCVVIDRLPFPSPDDPVLDAIKERDSRWFRRHALPRAIIAFRQGFGRLIRRAGDRGVVVVLDRRLLTKSYGRLFLRSLPRVPLSRDIQDVSRFLDTTVHDEPPSGDTHP